MDFGEALAAMKRGERVRRAHWRAGKYASLVRDKFEITKGNGCYIPFVPLNVEMNATDWEVVKPAPKTYSFAEACREAPEGSIITRLHHCAGDKPKIRKQAAYGGARMHALSGVLFSDFGEDDWIVEGD